MGKFLESEKPKQATFKANSSYFSNAAREDGFYKTKLRPFCLPVECSKENLFPEIRETAPAHFLKHEIKWHDGQNQSPSNHLCDSQVCCVNFLFPFSDKPNALAKLLRPIFPGIDVMLPVEDGQYVSFEWIGEHNYLCEKISRNRKRTRGANFTSTDAIVRFKRKDGKIQVVLIEWKYTESYGRTSLIFSKSRTDRREIYRHLYERDDCPFNKNILSSFDALFFEPFYQFMRQQFLANEMEKASELDANIVSLLHIAPVHNTDFRKVTSSELEYLGDSSIGIWKKLVNKNDSFISISAEQLFGELSPDDIPEIKTWTEYIYARYAWVREQ
jgi:hypothetical protein